MKLFELEDRPELDKVFPRSIMPQVRKNNLEDSGYKFEKKKIKLSKIKPVQDQRVQGMHDRALQGFQDGSIRPIIIDKHNYIVNGHHRYDVARSLDLDKVKVLKVDATIEELIDHYSDKTSDAPTIEQQLKSKLQQKLKEIERNEPYKNNDDSYIASVYNNATSDPQPFGENAYLKFSPIPGLSKNEVYDNGTSRHIFLMNHDQPIFMLTLKKSLDGWVTTNVVTHSQYSGKGFAVPVYIAVSKTYKEPLYSFQSQTPAGNKVWQNLAKKVPDRVVGYDTHSKKEISFTDGMYDGNVHTRAKLLPESIQRRDCYEAAVKQMLEYAKENPAMVNSLSLVHGYVTGQASYVKDQRYGHGWLEIGDVVQDCTNNAVMRKEQYYKLGNINPDELKKYSYKDVLQKISTTKHYGPWDLEQTEFEKGIEEDVVGMNPHAKKPYFTPQEADRANAEWLNQAQVDQEDGVIIKSTDGKQYRIMTSYGNQHFEDGEVYLDGITDAGYIDPEGYPDAAELLYYHSATGHYPDEDDAVYENKQFPQDVQRFVNNLVPTDVGVETVGEYVVHFEGFTDECNDGHDDESIDNVYADVYQDFDDRQGQKALLRGVAYDELGCGNNPVLYSVYKNVNESVNPDKMTGDEMRKLLDKKHAWDDGMHNQEFINDVRRHNWVLINNYPLAKLGSVEDPYDRVIDTDDDYAMRNSDLSEPIVIAPDRKSVMDGNHRVHKAREMGKTHLPAYFPMIEENFKDGKKKGKSRPGRVKKAGASCKGSVTSLRKKAKNSSGEKAKMYHWCANMKAGRKKK